MYWLQLSPLGVAGAACATAAGYILQAVIGITFFITNRKGVLYLVRPKFHGKALGKANRPSVCIWLFHSIEWWKNFRDPLLIPYPDFPHPSIVDPTEILWYRWRMDVHTGSRIAKYSALYFLFQTLKRQISLRIRRILLFHFCNERSRPWAPLVKQKAKNSSVYWNFMEKHIVNKSAALKSNLDCLLLYLTNPQNKHRTKWALAISNKSSLKYASYVLPKVTLNPSYPKGYYHWNQDILPRRELPRPFR